MKNGSLLIIYATVIHIITAIFVMSSSPILVSRLGYFYDIFPNHYTGAFLMLISSGLALVGLSKKDHKVMFFIPQLIFLVLASGSLLNTILLGHYVDGTIKPWGFIFIDQLPYFVGTFIYIFAIFDFRKGKKLDKTK